MVIHTMKNKLLIAFPLVIVIALIVFVITKGISQKQVGQSHNANKINVVSSINVYGDIAKSIGGKDVIVTNIINKQDVDPHDFEPTAKTMNSFKNADLIIVNGADYDTWAEKMAKNTKAKIVNVADLLDYKTGNNEHFWFDPQLNKTLAKQLFNDFAKIKGKDKDYFKDQLTKYLNESQKFEELVKKAKEKLSGTDVVTTEPVYDLTLKTLNMNVLDSKFAYAIEEGDDPTPSDINEFSQAIQEKRAKAVIYNSQSETKLVTKMLKLAKEYHIPIIEVTETKPDNLSYLQWQEKLLHNLIETIK